MFSVDYIHKSQDVSNRNLTNSKTRRLLREAYAIPYSVSPCEFLCWALSEPLFEISMGFMLLFLIAEVWQKYRLLCPSHWIIMPVTLDGFLPDKNEELMEWLRTDRNGFPYWEERATFNMYPHYGMLDLMDAKERRDNNCTFFMKVQDEKSAEYAGGVFLFRLADELVIYLLPISYKSGKNITGKIQFGQWTLRESKTFRNNVCRLVYRLKE